MSIYKEIKKERARQDAMWGGPSHDDKHTDRDWTSFIVKYVGAAINWPFSVAEFRRNMIIVGALSVAAVEWVDRLTERVK
jgi:hypothetical protein